MKSLIQKREIQELVDVDESPFILVGTIINSIRIQFFIVIGGLISPTCNFMSTGVIR
jgi:hypothetical protein